MWSKYFLKISGKTNDYPFCLPGFLKFCDNISHKLLRPTHFLEKFLKKLQTTLMMVRGGLVSEFMWRIVSKNKWKVKGGLEKPNILFNLVSLFSMFGISQVVLWLIETLPSHSDTQHKPKCRNSGEISWIFVIKS